jgi:hypothetical protein
MCINYDKNWVGVHFGRFLQTHLVTLLAVPLIYCTPLLLISDLQLGLKLL